MSDAKKEYHKRLSEIAGSCAANNEVHVLDCSDIYIKELEKQNKILLSGIKNQLQKGLSRYRTIKMIEEATGLSIEKFFEKTEDLK